MVQVPLAVALAGGLLAGALAIMVMVVAAGQVVNSADNPVQVRLAEMAVSNAEGNPVQVVLADGPPLEVIMRSDETGGDPATRPGLVPDPSLRRWPVGHPEVFQLANMPVGEDITISSHNPFGDQVFLFASAWSETAMDTLHTNAQNCSTPAQVSHTYTAPSASEAVEAALVLAPCVGGVGRITVTGSTSGYLASYSMRVTP